MNIGLRVNPAKFKCEINKINFNPLNTSKFALSSLIDVTSS